MPEPSAAARIAAAIGELLLRDSRSGMYAELVAGIDGVDEVTYPVLSGLARTGPVTASELARAVGLDRTVVSRYADRLEAAGLLVRGEDARDRRTAPLVLTTLGRSTIARARRRLSSRFAAVLAAYPESDRALVADVLDTLVASLRA